MKIHILILLLIFTLSGAGVMSATSYDRPEISDIHSEASTIEIKVQGHQLVIYNTGDTDEPVHVYALTGQSIKSFDATPGTTTYELPSGYYIVKTQKKSSRIIIR